MLERTRTVVCSSRLRPASGREPARRRADRGRPQLDSGGIESCVIGRAGNPTGERTAAEPVAHNPPVCVFDLDHTLVSSPLDLKAVGREMEAFVRERGLPLPLRELRWSGTELFAFVRTHAPALEAEILTIPQRHERSAMEQAVLEPFARGLRAEAAGPPRPLDKTTAWSPTSSSRASTCCLTWTWS
jgi:hypothetical protein